MELFPKDINSLKISQCVMLYGNLYCQPFQNKEICHLSSARYIFLAPLFSMGKEVNIF